MSITLEIERLQAGHRQESDVADQVETMRRLREHQAGHLSQWHPLGVDRSRELTPVVRPSTVRTLTTR